MALSSEQLQQHLDDLIFKRYWQLVATDPATLQNAPPVVEQLKDCRRKLLRMALAFNWECPREFTKKTIQAFEQFFLNLIYEIVSDPDLSDGEGGIFKGDLNKVYSHLRKAKLLFSNAQNALDWVSSNGETKLHFYNYLNESTISFENALGNWEPKETYKDLLPQDQNGITTSASRVMLVEIHKYFVRNGYYDMTDAFYNHELFLRQKIILTVLDAPDAVIRRKEGILQQLRKAKIYLNLAIDEREQQKQPSQPQKESKERLFQHLAECESCFHEALKDW